MNLRAVSLCAFLLLLCGCAFGRGPAPPVQVPERVGFPESGGQGPGIAFEAQVLPILEARCSPCHFEGGKVYDRLPFDREDTIVELGTRLLTRIKDEGEQEIILDFLAQASDGIDSSRSP